MLPDPLHPAVVHFPLVLLLLGALSAILSLFLFRKELFIASSVFFILGTLTAYIAVDTGSDAWDTFLDAFPGAKETLEIHAHWGDWTYRMALAATVFSVFTLITSGWPKISKVFRLLTCVMALVVGYYIYNTGHAGGHLVYHHAVKIAPSQTIKAAPFTE